mgnify:CR=1 FL=1
MNAEPFKKELFVKLSQAGITYVKLAFSGGSDEGYLDVTLDGKHLDGETYRKLEREVEDWAWDVYSYSGAGEGYEYGDTVEYDLVKRKVTTSEWATERVDGPECDGDLVIDGE